MVRRTQGPPERRPGSWGEALRQYAEDKKVVPALDNAQYVPHRKFRDRRFCKLDEQASYNVVTHKYRDAAQDDTVRQQEDQKKIDAVNRGRDRALKACGTWDPIKHEHKIPGIQEPNGPERKFSAPSFTDYNIISNLSFTEHHFASPSQRPAPRPEPVKKNMTVKAQVELRDYDIVSNQYFHNHDERSQREGETNKTELVGKYWKTHSYNPVVATDYSEKREAAYLRVRDETSLQQGTVQLHKLPSVVRRSEGRVYNIISHVPAQPEVLKAMDDASEKKRLSHTLRYRVEANMTKAGEQRQELAEKRIFNRITGAPHPTEN